MLSSLFPAAHWEPCLSNTEVNAKWASTAPTSAECGVQLKHWFLSASLNLQGLRPFLLLRVFLGYYTNVEQSSQFHRRCLGMLDGCHARMKITQ